jgi:hypothetical protein
MKSKIKYISLLLLIVVYVFSFSGCSKLFGPSDEDVIKAINESGHFKGGVGGLTLQSPIVILEKGSRNKDGSWPVKVKVVFTTYLNKEQTSAPVEKTVTFNMHKAKDSTGKTLWRAELGQ